MPRATKAASADPPADVAADVPADPPAKAPASRWFEFVGAYPINVVARSLPVEPGDVVEWPAGAPDLTNWRPAPPPADTGDDTSEES